MKYKLCPICGNKCKPADSECPNDGADITSVKISNEAESTVILSNPVIEETNKFYKQCPACGQKCNKTDSECNECGADITASPLLNDEVKKEVLLDTSQEAVGKFIRICEECGHKNKANVRKCTDCGEDISHITLTASNETESEVKKYELLSIDGKCTLNITENIHIIGRENELSEYLSNKSYVGRKHARIEMRDSNIYLTDLNSTNRTYKNNAPIEKNIPVLITEGDAISFGGTNIDGNYQDKAAYFIVRGKC